MITEKPSKLRIVSDACGNYQIEDVATKEKIIIKTSKMTMDDLRVLLNGLGNIFMSISSQLWDKEFKTRKARRK